LGCIIDRLKVRRPKQRITEKLLEMGLIQDRKEVRKKRVKKSKHTAFPGKLGSDMLLYSQMVPMVSKFYLLILHDHLQSNAGIVPKLDHAHFLAHPF
jgi:hypothetical protein